MSDNRGVVSVCKLKITPLNLTKKGKTMTQNNKLTCEPTPLETISVVLPRKKFNSFLHEIHQAPDYSWKAAQVELNGDAVASSKFDRIEFFADTAVGPFVAQREAISEDVHITMRKPTVGISRLAVEIIEEMNEAVLQPS